MSKRTPRPEQRRTASGAKGAATSRTRRANVEQATSSVRIELLNLLVLRVRRARCGVGVLGHVALLQLGADSERVAAVVALRQPVAERQPLEAALRVCRREFGGRLEVAADGERDLRLDL